MKYPSPAPGAARDPSVLPVAPLDVAVVGAGRVGCSIGRALAARHHRIAAASVARPGSAQRVREALGDVPLLGPEDAVLAANVVVLAVPDDLLGEMARRVAPGLCPGGVVLHTSGISGVRVLGPCGENVAAIHPAQTVPEPTTDLTGVTFGITAPSRMTQWADWFVAELGGIPLHVPEENRVLYHAALSIASNFTVTLAADAADLLGDGAALGPLLRQSVDNAMRLGGDAALTGPIVRGDAGTVRKHLAALAEAAPHLVEMYVVNARRALRRAVVSGRLDDVKAGLVARALNEGAAP